MGFFDMFRPRNQPIGGGVPGTAQVVSISPYEGSGEYRQAHMSLVVSAPNLTPTAVEFDGLIHHQLWPKVGDTLPVSVNPNKPTTFAVLWEQVGTSRDLARDSAEQLAATLGQRLGQGLTSSNVEIVGDVSKVTPEQREKLKAFGIDLDALAAGATSFTVNGGADDRVSQLERLAALRDKGALTEAEFAKEKARILGS